MTPRYHAQREAVRLSTAVIVARCGPCDDFDLAMTRVRNTTSQDGLAVAWGEALALLPNDVHQPSLARLTAAVQLYGVALGRNEIENGRARAAMELGISPHTEAALRNSIALVLAKHNVPFTEGVDAYLSAIGAELVLSTQAQRLLLEMEQS